MERASAVLTGVTFTIRRMSFRGRLELLQRVRELGQRLAFLEAGKNATERLEAAEVGQRVRQAYLEWGLVSVRGLVIDGAPATVETLLAGGPEALCLEVVEAVQAQCGLSEDERKN